MLQVCVCASSRTEKSRSLTPRQPSEGGRCEIRLLDMFRAVRPVSIPKFSVRRFSSRLYATSKRLSLTRAPISSGILDNSFDRKLSSCNLIVGEENNSHNHLFVCNPNN